jgi:hypothetical protein
MRVGGRRPGATIDWSAPTPLLESSACSRTQTDTMVHDTSCECGFDRERIERRPRGMRPLRSTRELVLGGRRRVKLQFAFLCEWI